jgi:triphosphatase
LDSPNREIESKYRVLDPAQLDDLIHRPSLSDVLSLAPATENTVTDIFFDTADYALLRAGLSLRWRRQSSRHLLAVKGLARPNANNVLDRFEMECETRGGADLTELGNWPAAIVKTIARHMDKKAALRPIAELRQVRTKRIVEQAATSGDGNPDGTQVERRDTGRPIGELSLDVVTVRDPADLTGTQASSLVQFAELEFELGDGVDQAAMEPIGKVFSHNPFLAPAQSSKLERALQELSAHPAGYQPDVRGIQPGMSMAEAGRSIWREQIMAMLLNEHGARQGKDIEYVHDMRVAIRRARAAVEMFGPYFRKNALRPYLQALRRTGKTLGTVRDLDVALDNLARYSRKRTRDERRQLNAAAKYWRAQRKSAYRELLAWLNSPKYSQFIAEFVDFCHTPGRGAISEDRVSGQDPKPFQVRHVLPSTILVRFEAVRAYEVVLDSVQPVSVEILHALRMECKRLRYSLEFTHHLLGSSGDALIQHLKQIQDHLGDLNDASITRARLMSLQAQGAGSPALGRYIQQQEEIIRERRDAFPLVWEPFISRENRQLVGESVAQF